MNVIVILVLISLGLVAGALILLFSRILDGDFDHGERLSLLPLEPDEIPAGPEGESAHGK